MEWLQVVNTAIVRGELNRIATLVEDAIKDGIDPYELMNMGMIPAMDMVAKLWKDEEYFLPEVLRSAKTMQAGMDVLKRYFKKGGHGKGIKVAIGTVKGDQHDIGKNLVAIMLEGVGYTVEDLGVDVPPERFLEAAREGARVVGMSSLLTTSMMEMKTVIDLFKSEGMRRKALIIVGGAPVTKEYAMNIGADHYAEDAAEAVKIMKEVFG